MHYLTPCHQRQLNLPDCAFQKKKLISVSSSVSSSTVVSQLAPRLNRVLRSPFAADTPSSRGAAWGKSLTTCPWKQGRGGVTCVLSLNTCKAFCSIFAKRRFFFPLRQRRSLSASGGSEPGVCPFVSESGSVSDQINRRLKDASSNLLLPCQPQVNISSVHGWGKHNYRLEATIRTQLRMDHNHFSTQQK